MSVELLNINNMEYMAGVPDKFFDLALVDPPYGMSNKKGRATDRIKKYGQLKTVNDMKPDPEYFVELFRVSKNQVIWGYNHLSDMLPSCREFVFWYKHNPVPTYSDGELAWTSFEKTAKCFDLPYFGTVNADIERIHPTQKPVKLYEWLLNRYAKPGDKILDTHLGSGSSAIAAHYAGYEFVGTEIDDDYFLKLQRRFDLETRQASFL